MAVNPMRGEAELAVGDRTLKLTLDVNSWCLIQPALGMKPMQIVSAFESDPDDMVVLRGLLWGALQKHHDCHLIEAGEIMADAGFLPTRSALTACLAAAFGTADPEGKEVADPPEPRRSRGTG